MENKRQQRQKFSDMEADQVQVKKTDAHGAETGETSKTSNKEPKKRIPRENGRWEGEPGNSNWYSDLDEVNEITGGKPILFKDGRPIFSEWSKGNVKFENGNLNGSGDDFKKVYQEISKSKGLKNPTAAKNLLKEKGLTPHHLDNNTIELIPSKLHGNIPHIGSASDLRLGL